ncbi:MAG: protoporphyrinogen oxidase HemJ [Gammaproteobacteria bacterium]|nr:MAG: protoporphyrinogen oxidase HemJ [Gammaproteobacteria bacterium]
MYWIKAFHIIFMVSWFAGLFYLPRLFVYHAMAQDEGDTASMARLKIMERKLYYFILPWMILTLVFGTWLWLGYGITGGWLHAKLFLVALLLGYHHACGRLMKKFARDENTRSHVFYRWFNEVPIVLLLGVVVLVVVKPF